MKWYLLGCLFAIQSLGAFSQEGVLFYVGSTETSGWQIFRYDFASRKSTQLSFSAGDKRNPQYCRGLRVVTCRDSLGQIIQVNGAKESLLLTNLSGCSNYSVTQDGRSVYFTKPAPEKRRQDIWVQRVPEASAPELVASVPEGMLKQVCVSPNGRWLAATHIWRPNEERLVLIPAKEGKPIDYLTPDRSLDAFPQWTADSECILFSMTTATGKYSISKVCLRDKQIETLRPNPSMNECNPATDSAGQFVFFEQRTPEGSVIACLDTKAHEVGQLPMPHESKEPFWYENK